MGLTLNFFYSYNADRNEGPHKAGERLNPGAFFFKIAILMGFVTCI